MFRGENKRPIDLGVVDRFHAEAVAGNSEPFFLGVPDGESEHAVELKQGVEAPLGKCLQQHFTVARRVEGVAPRRQLQLQLLVIVDFPVVGKHISSVARFHRLARRIGQINDRQTPVAKANRSVAIMTLAVRPPMRDNISHRLQ